MEEFVTENLEHALPFVLVDSASGQRLDDDSTKDSALIDLGLIPGKGWEEQVCFFSDGVG